MDNEADPARKYFMKRVVILGRGGAGKSTAARQLSDISGLTVIELDKHFWQPGLRATPIGEWKQIQKKLSDRKRWIMDGDLGKYDALDVRLGAADTVIILDFSLIRCLLRAIHRSRERADFWWWLLTWRWLSRPKIIKSVNSYAKAADVYILRTPKALDQFLASIKG